MLCSAKAAFSAADSAQRLLTNVIHFLLLCWRKSGVKGLVNTGAGRHRLLAKEGGRRS